MQDRVSDVGNWMKNLIAFFSSSGSISDDAFILNILKPVLARSELQCIGTTTNEEYKKHIQKDAALERRFQIINIPEPSILETVLILHGIRYRYEQHHMMKISDEALIAAAKLSAQYIPDRYLPDKAIDLIDEACASLRTFELPLPPAIENLYDHLKIVVYHKDAAIREHNYADAIVLHQRESETREALTNYLIMEEKKEHLTAFNRVLDANKVAKTNYIPRNPYNISILIRNTNCNQISQQHYECKAPPKLWLLDNIIGENSDCVSKYSDINFFFSDWLRSELKRQDDNKEKKRKAKKSNRNIFQ
jgi:ATP-dependent Clp protease ATP-binding subunit ClpA